MSKEYWFPWTPARFRGDTMHLSAEQDGIYRRLIDHYMETGLPLPDNDSALARIAGISGETWAIAAAILRPFFRQSDGRLWLKKCDEILADQASRSEENSRKGRAGASKRWRASADITEENSSGHTSDKADVKPEYATRQDITGQERKKDPVVDPAHVEEIFQWLQKFLNSTSPLFKAPITAWLSWGADLDLDIKPVAERWRKSNPKKGIRSLEWLDDDMAASIRKRSKPMPDKQSGPKGDAYADRPQSFSANRSGHTGGGGVNKTDRAKAAVLRAAVAGGYAPEAGHEGQAGAGDNVVSMLPGAEGLG
jgi:uncharacterized protein YdaU (DUF1376 family)